MDSLLTSERWRGSWAAEARAIEREPDAEMRAAAQLVFADRLMQSGQQQLAAAVYQELAQDPHVGAMAQETLKAFRGTGTFASEYHLQNLARQTLDPVTIFSFSAAQAAFRLTRTFSFARGIGPKSLLGLSAEALAFPLASRLSSSLLGREGERQSSLGQEIVSSFLLFGALRAMTSGLARLPFEQTRHSIFQQGAMLSGIALGQKLDYWMQGRHEEFSLMQCFNVWLQANLGAGIASRWLGKNFLAREAAWSATAAERKPSPSWKLPANLSPAKVSPLPNSRQMSAQSPLATSAPLLMLGAGDGARGARISLLGQAKSRETSGVVQRSPDYRALLLEFLEKPEMPQRKALQGPLAEWLQHDPMLRADLQQGLGESERPAWVEVNNSNGTISKIFFFRQTDGNLQPERLLFLHDVLRYTESFDTILLEFHFKGQGAIVGNFYYPGMDGPPRAETYLSGKIANPRIVGPGRLRWSFFEKSSQELHLEQADGNWEFRDTTHHLVLKLP